MVDAAKYTTMEKFHGLNNVDDPMRLAPILGNREYLYPLQQASNIDIDNTYGISSRSGYDDVLTGSDIHSLWSDEAETICLYVDGTTLNQLTIGYTALALRSGLTTSARMSYAAVNDRSYYTNGYEIGYVKSNVSNLLADPDLEFKLPLPAGQLIGYYKGCIYVASGSILYISDPLCDYFDIRTGYKQFASDITLLRAVDDGLYIGDEQAVWWVKGDSAEEFSRDLAYSHRPIPFTDTRIPGQYIGDGIKGNVAIWTGANGICIGDNSGQVTNLTESRFTFTSHGRGAGFLRSNNNVRHYINSLF